jgi:hypothetical protein
MSHFDMPKRRAGELLRKDAFTLKDIERNSQPSRLRCGLPAEIWWGRLQHQRGELSPLSGTAVWHQHGPQHRSRIERQGQSLVGGLWGFSFARGKGICA